MDFGIRLNPHVMDRKLHYIVRLRKVLEVIEEQ